MLQSSLKFSDIFFSFSDFQNCKAELHVAGLAAKSPRQGVHHPDSNHLIHPHGVVELDNGSAFYDGYSYLEIPFLKSAEFPAGITVEFTVTDEPSSLRQVTDLCTSICLSVWLSVCLSVSQCAHLSLSLSQ